jgi:hypothetical protein
MFFLINKFQRHHKVKKEIRYILLKMDSFSEEDRGIVAKTKGKECK